MKRRFSFTDHKSQRNRIPWIILVILIFFLLYISFSSLFFTMRVLENETMAPNLRAGERLIFSSYVFYSLIPVLDKSPPPLSRGSIVLVDMFRGERPGLFYSILDGALRFFTFQRLGFIEQKDHLFVKRIIGLPGDEITMTNFVIRVKVKGSAYSLTEFEVTDYDYSLDLPQLPALWDSSLPFSGNLDKIVLGDNECFVLSDDRSNTNDSRTWGPVPIKSISGKALFRYWPIVRLGRP